MMAPDSDEVQILLQDALAALKIGDKNMAHNLAEQAASLAPESEAPWLILAAVASPEESLTYVKKALQINPESKSAQQALEWTLKRQSDRSPAPETEPPREPTHPPVSPSVPVETIPEPPSKPIHPPTSPVSLTDILPRAAPSSPPAKQRKKFSLSRTRILVFALLGLAIIFCVVLLAFWFGRPLLGRIAQIAPPIQPTEVIPTILVATPNCGSSTLVLGTATFQIQSLAPGPDGTLLVPSNIANVAYWVQGTDQNYLFMLSPAPENLSLASTLAAESTATTTWANCNSESYSLSAPEQGSLTSVPLPDQSIPGIEIFFQTDASGNGILFKGELAEEQINTFNMPASGGTEVQAEIGLLETTTSPDSSAVQLTVSVYNFGGTPITLTTNDVSLTPPGAEPSEMTKSNPRLPAKISPAETKNFTFTFPRPVTPTATLRIFTVEYDIEGY